MHRSRAPTALGLLVLAVLGGVVAAQQQSSQGPNDPRVVSGLPEPIPLALLQGDAKHRNPQLTNDGKYLAYIRPDPATKVNNVFVRKLPSASELSRMNPASPMLDQQGPDADKQVTFDPKRGVYTYSWAEDGSALFYMQDTDGDENNHLYMVPIDAIEHLGSGSSAARPETIDITPFKGVKVQGIITSERFPRRMFLTLNKRDPRVFDLYLMDLDTKAVRLYMVNPGEASSWLVDYDMNVRGIDAYNSTDGSTFVLINDALPAVRVPAASSAGAVQQEKGGPRVARPGMTLDELFAKSASGNWTTRQWMDASISGANLSSWRTLITWPFQEEGAVFRFNRAGNGLYGVSSDNRDTTEFQLISTAPGAKVLRRIADNPDANAGVAVFNPRTWEPQLVSFNYLKTTWVVLDPEMKPHWQRLESFRPDAVPNIVSRSYDLKKWIVSYSADNATTQYYLYQPGGAWPPQLVLEMQPGLKAYQLANMRPVVFTARDGLRIPAYLTLPVRPGVPAVLPACATGDVPDAKPAAKAAAAASPLKCPMDLKLPLILYVHGGPWSRDTWGADSVVQFLANRGYAVLQVNYRGSTGYGKSFVNAGNHQWGIGAMQHDLTDAVRWAVEKGIADTRRVCIMGGSYGGYATLAGLAFTPQLYACGVDLVGISNVETFMKAIPPYWEPILIDFIQRVGDVSKNATLNRAISPLFHVDKVRAPLLIGQGANDPRVPKLESDQMFKAMKAKGLDVHYVLYPDEGHGLVMSANRLDYYARVEQFLGKHLAGRAGPLVLPKGSAAKVITEVP